jgi:hypothetical protein
MPNPPPSSFDADQPMEAEVLGYGQPDPKLAPRPVFDGSTAVVLWPWAFVLTLLFGVVTPRFEVIFRDFGTQLPTVTVVLLRFSRFFLNNYGWVVVWAIAVGAPFAVAPLRRPVRGRRRSFALAITVLLCGATVAFGIIGLYAPMISLIQSVSGGAKK